VASSAAAVGALRQRVADLEGDAAVRLAKAVASINEQREPIHYRRVRVRIDLSEAKALSRESEIDRLIHELTTLDQMIAPLDQRIAEAKAAARSLLESDEVYRTVQRAVINEANRLTAARDRLAKVNHSGETALLTELAASLQTGQLLSGWAAAFISKMDDELKGELRRTFGFLIRDDFVFAPAELMAALFERLAISHCDRMGWLPVGAIGPTRQSAVLRRSSDFSVETEVLAFFMRFPVHTAEATLEDVVQFRVRHGEELAEMRAAVGQLVNSEIDEASAIADLRADVERALRAPLAEVTQALEKRGHKATNRIAAFARNPRAIVPVAGALLWDSARSALSTVLDGNSVVTAFEHQTTGAAPWSVLGVGLVTSAAWASVGAWRADRNASRGPLAYLYEVQQAFAGP
jgi:hypothetical protein